MPAFKDKTGREWLVRIDGPQIKEVRKVCGLDLGKPEVSFQELADDPTLVIDVLWVLVREQAGGITDVAFGQALVGDCLEAAAQALVDGVLDFFPTRKQSLLRSLGQKQVEMTVAGEKLLLEKLTDPQLMADYLRLIENQIEMNLKNLLQTGSSGATKSPDSSASGPTVSPLPNSSRWPQADEKNNGSWH